MDRRTLIPVTTILLSLTTAIALLVTALTLTALPAPAALPTAPPTISRVPSPVAARAVWPPSTRRVMLARGDPIALPTAPLVLAFARLTYRPGDGGLSQALPGPLLLVVDAGALAARVEAPGRLHGATDAAAPPLGDCRGACRLAVGDSLMLPAATGASIQNLGTAPAVALAATLVPAAATSAGLGRTRAAFGPVDPPRWNPAWSPGANVTPLGGGWVVDLDAPAATLALARLSLEPDAHETLPAIGAQALAVETGALTLTTEGGLVWQQRPGEGDEWLGSNTPTTLLTGEEALLQAGASARLRNDGGGPLAVLLLTVAPAEPA